MGACVNCCQMLLEFNAATVAAAAAAAAVDDDVSASE
jgi:hypothetical protein